MGAAQTKAQIKFASTSADFLGSRASGAKQRANQNDLRACQDAQTKMICFLAIGLHAGFDPFDPARSQGLGRGSLGVLLAGKRQGLLAEIKSCLDSLLQHGFYIAPHLYKKFLSDAGETP